MANILQETVNVSGRKIPVWTIGAGVIGAGVLFVISKLRGGMIPVPAQPQEQQAAGQPGDNSAQFQKALEQQQQQVGGALSQLQGQFENTTAQLTGQYEKQQEQFNALTAAQAQQQQNFGTQIASALAKQQEDFQNQLSALRNQNFPVQTYQNYIEPAKPTPVPAPTPAPQPAPPPPPSQLPPSAPTPSTSLVGVATYTVKSGDTLSAIARRAGITLNQLLSYNPQFQANPNLIRPGQVAQLVSNEYFTT